MQLFFYFYYLLQSYLKQSNSLYYQSIVLGSTIYLKVLINLLTLIFKSYLFIRFQKEYIVKCEKKIEMVEIKQRQISLNNQQQIEEIKSQPKLHKVPVKYSSSKNNIRQVTFENDDRIEKKVHEQFNSFQQQDQSNFAIQYYSQFGQNVNEIKLEEFYSQSEYDDLQYLEMEAQEIYWEASRNNQEKSVELHLDETTKKYSEMSYEEKLQVLMSEILRFELILKRRVECDELKSLSSKDKKEFIDVFIMLEEKIERFEKEGRNTDTWKQLLNLARERCSQFLKKKSKKRIKQTIEILRSAVEIEDE